MELVLQPKPDTSYQWKQRREPKQHEFCRKFGISAKKQIIHEQQLHYPSEFYIFENDAPETLTQQGHTVGTHDTNPYHYGAWVTKPANHFLKSAALNCES